MAKKSTKQPTTKTVETLMHDADKRKNIPTAEFQSVAKQEDQNPVRVAYERRNRDLDPQLVWRGKDEQDWSDLVVHAPPLYIQEKVHPKVLIDDLLKQMQQREKTDKWVQQDLFADFNGIPEGADKTDIHQHDQNWSNRMILGNSLHVMASLAEREGLRGKVQCIYIDPPYGIKFNSNFQWSTTSRDVKDAKIDQITREPEQVAAFRDTWRDGIHSYLTHLRDRLTVARKRAAIFIGPEFGTVQRADLVAAAREAGDAAFDVLIASAFNFEAHTTEFSKLGRIPVLKARMNADLHMSDDLKNTGKGNLFVIFGEPDIVLLPEKDGQVRVRINGVDVFDPNTGEVRSDGTDGIACWFIDTDYNEESFFVRHAYFLGANDPYSALKTTLKAEINAEAWATLNSDTSRPFDKPKSGRIAVKVINHLGDEVMKVFRV